MRTVNHIETEDDILDALLPPHEPSEIPEPTWSEPAIPPAVSQLVSDYVGMTMRMLDVEAKLRFLARADDSLFRERPEAFRVLTEAIKLCEQARTGKTIN